MNRSGQLKKTGMSDMPAIRTVGGPDDLRGKKLLTGHVEVESLIGL